MGTDKRLALVDGVPMLLRTLGRLAPAPALVIVDPRAPIPLALPPHTRLVPDTRPGEGPLAALEAGLRATDAPIVLVVAGDMPWIEPRVLALLASRLLTDATATVACLAGEEGPRPLPLGLRREPVLARLTPLLDSGERRLTALLPGASMVPALDWLPLDPRRDTFRDVDTPADLATTG